MFCALLSAASVLARQGLIRLTPQKSYYDASCPTPLPALVLLANDPHRLLGFGACLIGAAVCFAAAFFSLPLLILRPGG